MNIHSILRRINRDLVPQFEEKLRTYLHEQDREWLIEQIVRLTLDAHSLQENDRKRFVAQKEQRRAERLARVRELELCDDMLRDYLEQYSPYSRESLIMDGFLLNDAPEKGTDLILHSRETLDGHL